MSPNGRKQINEYEVIKKIGDGTSGKVKHVRNVITGEEFALKCFNKFLLRKRTKLLRLPNGSKIVIKLKIIRTWRKVEET